MTTVKTKTCCEVVDQIVEWTSPDGTLNIEPGDLILWNGALEQVATVEVRSEVYTVLFSFEGSGALRRAKVTDLVAVRRYTETSESSP